MSYSSDISLGFLSIGSANISGLGKKSRNEGKKIHVWVFEN